MADGQTQAVPEASVEDRLSSFFSQEATPEVAKPEAEGAVETQQSEAETAAETTEDVEEVQAETTPEDWIEVEADDGETVKVPAKLKDHFLRWSDYSKKTEAVAQLAKSAEDKLQFAEAQQQIFGAVMSDVAELRALQTQRQQYDQVDWGALYNADLGQAVKLRDQRDALDKQIADKATGIRSKTEHAQNALSRHRSTQWQMAVEGAKQRIGPVSAADDAAMLAQVRAVGFTPEELQGRFADPRFLQLVHKASKWDAAQAGKPQALQSAAKAPPVLKPGASQGPGAAQRNKYSEVRAALKKSGDVRDAARLFMLKAR